MSGVCAVSGDWREVSGTGKASISYRHTALHPVRTLNANSPPIRVVSPFCYMCRESEMALPIVQRIMPILFNCSQQSGLHKYQGEKLYLIFTPQDKRLHVPALAESCGGALRIGQRVGVAGRIGRPSALATMVPASGDWWVVLSHRCICGNAGGSAPADAGW